MKRLFILIIILIIYPMTADVINPSIHQPSVPFYMETINFQTIESAVFGDYAAGMLGDPYSDLSWNPAAIMNLKNTRMYLQFNYEPGPDEQSYYINPAYDNQYMSNIALNPSWINNSPISTINTTPIYHFAIISRLTENLSLGLINRSIFDYGPFRSANVYTGFRNEDALSWKYSEMELKALEVDDNQQKVLGNQAEIYLGYNITEKLDLGLKLGHYICRRDGDLYDSEWSENPHFDYADLNDEALNIDGHHLDLGIGLKYDLSEATRVGIYGGYMIGHSKDGRTMLDTTYSWSESAEEQKYYSIHKYNFSRDEDYTSDATMPHLALHFETEISRDLLFRTYFKARWQKADIEGDIYAFDTTFSDRTYDDYDNGSYHFRRRQIREATDFGLSGEGARNYSQYKGFASLIFNPEDEWSIFGGLYFSYTSLEKDYTESSEYNFHGFTEYTKYEPGTIKILSDIDKDYAYTSENINWNVIFPVGLKINVTKNLQLLAGTDLQFQIVDEQSRGDLVNPEKIYKKWENGELVIDDQEIERYERYSSDPSLDVTRDTNINFGAIYKQPSGFRIYIGSGEEIFSTEGWSIGAEMIF